MEARKVRIYDILGLSVSNDTLLSNNDSILKYRISGKASILNTSEREILTFLITDPNMFECDYAPIRHPFHPDFILEFKKRKRNAYMLFSLGSEEVGMSDSEGNMKIYRIRNKRQVARWASMVFPNEEYYIKLSNIGI